MKSKIIFDTNILWKDSSLNIDEIFNSNLNDIVSFKEKNTIGDITLCLPEVVVEERLTQQGLVLEALKSSVENSVRKLEKVDYKYLAPDEESDFRGVLNQIIPLGLPSGFPLRKE